jgi:hypothetical protein
MAVIKVFDRLPNVGDALFLVSGVKTWVRYSESAPSGGTFVSTVLHRDGHEVYILDKTAVNLQYKTENTADGASNNTYLRKDGSIANYRGIMNTARGVAYWGSNGRTPSANEPVPATTNSDPVNRTAFETSEYCKLLRQTYASYESYIGEGMGVKFPQEYGCFGLPSGKVITYQYNDAEHPGFQHCAAVDYGVDGIAAGDWYMPGVYEGTALMRDRVLTKVAATMTKFGGAVPDNSSYRWFAQRCSGKGAWFFSGGSGTLYGNGCASTRLVQAVARLTV